METSSVTRRRLLTLSAAAVGGAALSGPLGSPAAAADRTARDPWPTTIQLPDGFRPEGIAIGAGPVAYFGSLADGAVYRANLATGEGALLGPGPGASSVGLKLDGHGRLFICGGGSGQLRVVASRNGVILKTYQAGTGETFVNDVILTGRAAWFTDSRQPQLYVLRLGRKGRLPDGFETVPLSGDWVQAPPGTNSANGITLTPDGTGLLVVNGAMDGGTLVRVDPRSGAAQRVDLGGTKLPNGDGMLLLGRTLYVVQNRQNAIDVLRLDKEGRTGTAITRITDPRFDVPTTAARYGDRLYLPNARFTTTPTPETPYTAVAVRL